MGQLTNITYPRGSHYGAVSRKEGCRLNSVWEEYSNDYGVFGVSDTSSDPEYPPLNNAPSTWSSVDLDTPYTRDSPSRPWVSERVWKIKCDLSSRFFKKYCRLPASDEILDMD